MDRECTGIARDVQGSSARPPRDSVDACLTPHAGVQTLAFYYSSTDSLRAPLAESRGQSFGWSRVSRTPVANASQEPSSFATGGIVNRAICNAECILAQLIS